MSWELFRQNVLRVANAPENINNIDLVAETYAREYDAAVKRGGDTISKIPLTKGNVDSMKQFFKMALEKGLSSKANYDLVGEMGAGVISYWTMGTMANVPPPFVSTTQIMGGAIANIIVAQNIITNPGKWGVIQVAGSEVKLKPEQLPQSGLTGANVTTADPIDTNTKEKILFVGDSLSAIKTETGINITWTYPTSVRKSLPNATVDVLAIPAKQTSWMLQNLPSQLATTKYDRVYIWGGTNDMFSGVSFKAALGNIQKMVDLAISNGAKAYVIIGYDVKNMDYTRLKLTRYLKDISEYIPLIERYNEYQQQMPTTIQNAKFIGIFDLGPLTTDGIHPSAVQARQIANIIINAL